MALRLFDTIDYLPSELFSQFVSFLIGLINFLQHVSGYGLARFFVAFITETVVLKLVVIESKSTCLLIKPAHIVLDFCDIDVECKILHSINYLLSNKLCFLDIKI